MSIGKTVLTNLKMEIYFLLIITALLCFGFFYKAIDWFEKI
ncbi:hypothetical protein [Larkinella arboricola]|nr:hypothetical protein [Larkinella arboricola]